ncbi:hypothetical protein CB337_22080 [Salmonella enterica subsp. enterica serovar Agbeni]|nr:hypothetical protein [Salmonella enterica subsp. enterica serovar Agbeni]
MNKFEHIENIAGDMIVHSFEMDLKGVPSKAYVLEFEGDDFSVLTPLKEDDPEIIISLMDDRKSEYLHGHYEGVFECQCTLKGILKQLASEECMCPECRKEQQRKKINSNPRKKRNKRKGRK